MLKVVIIVQILSEWNIYSKRRVVCSEFVNCITIATKSFVATWNSRCNLNFSWIKSNQG